MNQPTQRWVAWALRAGGPEVIEVGLEELPPLKTGEVLVRVEAVGLNHAETLIRSALHRSTALSVPTWWRGIGCRRRDRAGGADFCGEQTPLTIG
jgi:NADPH:quinone reductase-like Zn-dependent oxidoreductase